MVVKVQVHGIDALQARLRGLSEGKIKVAAVAALNQAAFAGREAGQKEMRRVFDNPTKWVTGGIRYVKASRDNLTAKVDLDFWGNKQGVAVEKILAAEITGGDRRLKRHEKALQRVGILPPGMFIIPGDAADKDAFGNMSSGQIVQIMSWFQAFGEQGHSANMRDGGKRLGRDNKKTGKRGFAYFVLKKPLGKLLPGIYKRTRFGFGSSAEPMMIFVRAPKYKRRLDFHGVVETAALSQFKKSYSEFLAQMLRERGL